MVGVFIAINDAVPVSIRVVRICLQPDGVGRVRQHPGAIDLRRVIDRRRMGNGVQHTVAIRDADIDAAVVNQTISRNAAGCRHCVSAILHPIEQAIAVCVRLVRVRHGTGNLVGPGFI